MTCLGWGASTTGPPRIAPSQCCKHLSVMTFIYSSVMYQKTITNYLKIYANFTEYHLGFKISFYIDLYIIKIKPMSSLLNAIHIHIATVIFI